MTHSRKKHKSNENKQAGGFKRFLILFIYHLFIGHKYTMAAAISIAPLGIISLSTTDKYILSENKFLSKYLILLIVFSIIWIPVYIRFGMWLTEWLIQFELREDWRLMSNEERFKLRLFS